MQLPTHVHGRVGAAELRIARKHHTHHPIQAKTSKSALLFHTAASCVVPAGISNSTCKCAVTAVAVPSGSTAVLVVYSSTPTS